MKNRVASKIIGVGLITCGLLVAASFPLAAQEATPQQEGSGGQMEMQKMMEKRPGMMGEMHKMHEQMEKMDTEMTQELQKQLTALREHSKAMEGVSDEKQLLPEMKKHQQMTDAFLSTLVEQRKKMRAQMHEHHQQMHGGMGAPETKESGGAGHEMHHPKE